VSLAADGAGGAGGGGGDARADGGELLREGLGAVEPEPEGPVVVPYLPGGEIQPPYAPSPPAAQTERRPAGRKLPEGITARPDERPAPPPAVEEAPAAGTEVVRAPEPPGRQPGVVIKIILGLLCLLALAYLAGHKRVRQLEERLGIAQVVTAGFPFVALGLIARMPEVGVLTDAILVELSPLLHLGLGWIGFGIGFRFDARLLDTLPEGTAPRVAFSTGIPFLAIFLSAGLVLFGTQGWSSSLRDPVFIRDAIVLGSAGAITARTAARIISGLGPQQALVMQIIRLEELAGIAGLTLVAAYFRPHDEVSWQLPGTAWIFITLGLGATVGLVAYGILRRKASAAESLVLLLGTVAFASGLASNLLLSPIVVCFVAGVLLVNFPGDYKERVAATLARLERPIYLLFLVVTGAIWSVGDWRGWALMVVFLIARFFGGLLGAKLGWGQEGGELTLSSRERLVLAAAPMGQLSIAIVVSALLLYPHGNVPLIVTAVIGGAIFTEIAVQILARELRASTPGGEA